MRTQLPTHTCPLTHLEQIDAAPRLLTLQWFLPVEPVTPPTTTGRDAGREGKTLEKWAQKGSETAEAARWGQRDELGPCVYPTGSVNTMATPYKELAVGQWSK